MDAGIYPIRDDGGRPRVVVGVDGSPGSRAALVHALTTAAQRGAELEVVSSYPVNLVWTGGLPLEIPDTEAIRVDTESRARALVDDVRSSLSTIGIPGVHAVDVRLVVSEGRAVPELLKRSEHADLLVVGSRGRVGRVPGCARRGSRGRGPYRGRGRSRCRVSPHRLLDGRDPGARPVRRGDPRGPAAPHRRVGGGRSARAVSRRRYIPGPDNHPRRSGRGGAAAAGTERADARRRQPRAGRDPWSSARLGRPALRHARPWSRDARASAAQQVDCGGQRVGTGNDRVLISRRRAGGRPAAWRVPSGGGPARASSG
jgi:nucleotide-binding universal stress UspA family protein